MHGATIKIIILTFVHLVVLLYELSSMSASYLCAKKSKLDVTSAHTLHRIAHVLALQTNLVAT